MDRLASEASESRFGTYVEALVGAIGHADRAVPLRDYCLGLLMPGERKSVEPMAGVTAPDSCRRRPQNDQRSWQATCSPAGRHRVRSKDDRPDPTRHPNWPDNRS